jgi:HEAT repeat protein
VGGDSAATGLIEAVRRGRVGASAALLALAETGHPDALVLVLEKLGDDDPTVRESALAATQKLLDPARPDGRAVEPLERAFELARGRRTDQMALLGLLGRTGSPRAAKLLGPIAARADDLPLLVAALTALGSLGGEATRVVLLEALGDREPSVRLAAALSLRRSGAPGNASNLLDRLERAAAQERPALALALSGAFAKTESKAVIDRLSCAIDRSREGERDALIEAAGHAPHDATLGLLDRLAARADADDRRKVAEVSGLDAGARARLLRLARDPHPEVRANALWSLGAVGAKADLSVVDAAFGDRDPSAAANAVAAYARIARRSRVDVGSALCPALGSKRAVVRASALSGLRFVGARCPAAPERRLASEDASVFVRRAAVELLRDVEQTGDDRKALRRCVAEEPNGTVALSFGAEVTRPSLGAARTLVFVVPVGEGAPAARAPFALIRPDGFVRHGTADRRGAAYEIALPDGELELAVPAPFRD